MINRALNGCGKQWKQIRKVSTGVESLSCCQSPKLVQAEMTHPSSGLSAHRIRLFRFFTSVRIWSAGILALDEAIHAVRNERARIQKGNRSECDEIKLLGESTLARVSGFCVDTGWDNKHTETVKSAELKLHVCYRSLTVNWWQARM